MPALEVEGWLVKFGLYVSDILTFSRQGTLVHYVDDTAVTATSDQPTMLVSNQETCRLRT